MARRPEIGNVQLYPDRPLRADDKNGYVLKFYCPLRKTRIRRNCGTRDRREARRILRECRERLLNGLYAESGGAITVALAQAATRSNVDCVLGVPGRQAGAHRATTDGTEPPWDPSTVSSAPGVGSPTWEQCFDHYYQHRKKRSRKKSLADAASRIEIAGRILDAEREKLGLEPDGPIGEYATLASLELLQERLLAGADGRYDQRAPMTVNTMLGAVVPFLKHCKRHGWISEVPALEKLDVDEAMKGRPITGEEFDRFLEAVPEVVGERPAASWQWVLQILWESAFRVGDVMNFSWDDDERRIHPVWPTGAGRFPTLLIPSSQKNKKAQEIPMLPGLQALLKAIPEPRQRGWVANPLPLDGRFRIRGDWFKPTRDDLAALLREHNNSAIARACGVTETAVRKWFREAGFHRRANSVRHHGDVVPERIAELRIRAEASALGPTSSADGRLTTEYVGRVISAIGEKARIVVQQADEETGRRIKHASAHDIRRGCALRLINAGVSAETLMVVMRHKDFKTTQKFYGAVRAPQSAAVELHQKLAAPIAAEQLPQLNEEEVRKLRALLNSL